MLSITLDQIRLLQQPGGRAFTQVVDSLIGAHAQGAGISDAAVETNLRTNLADEGADTVVRKADDSDPTGWFLQPTVWQYKATAYSHVGSTDELLEGKYVKDRIKEAYAYRLVVADSVTSVQREKRAEELTRACRALNPSAPEAIVISADDIVEWMNRYPALVLRWFFSDLRDAVVHLEGWGSGATAATPKYVEIAEWENLNKELRGHFDLSNKPASVVRTVQGEAGVGKSRLVYEVLTSIPGMRGLALYTTDEEASLRIARVLANAPEGTKAILVADGCGPEAREQIRKLLSGMRDRIRVLAIDNSEQRDNSGDPELWLKKMPEGALEKVLEANFEHIPSERRRAYAELARGYPRLAADLCNHDGLILAAGGDIGPVTPTVREFLKIRLNEDQLEALQAVSLVGKIGFKGEVSEELDQLCGLVDIDAKTTRRALRVVAQGPGFIAEKGRYYLTTPEIVAQVAFEGAWKRWAAADAAGFLGKIPEELLPTFLDRVQRSGDQEVRRVCGEYFRAWATSLRPSELVNERTTARLVALVETHPDDYLPLLRRLVESASSGNLIEISGEAVDGRWGPRRALVWLAEKFAWFPEYFGDTERILIRLAAAESEPKISNNASAIWAQLFRLFLPGTAVPFLERLKLLEERLRAREPEVRALASIALEGVFAFHATRMAGPITVAGRLPPSEWHPGSRLEERKCLETAIEVAATAARSDESDVKERAIESLASNLRWFVSRGFFEKVQGILGELQLSDAQRVTLLEALDAVIVYDLRAAESEDDKALLARVVAWRDELIGTTLHSRLVAQVGRDRWGAARISDSSWQGRLDDLAGELLANSHVVRQELAWLFGGEARAAAEFGAAIGRLDGPGSLLADVLDHARARQERSFARGYVGELLQHHPSNIEFVNGWLDKHEERDALVVADIAIAGGAVTHALERVLRLYDRGAVPAGALYDRNFRSRDGTEIDDEDFERLVTRLGTAAAQGDGSALRVGLDALALRIRQNEQAADSLFDRQAVSEAAWKLVYAAATAPQMVSYWWSDVVVALSRTEPKRAAFLAAAVLIGESFGVREQAEKALATIASKYPNEAMDAIGEAALDETRGWVFNIANYRELIETMPRSVIQEWLNRQGVDGARRLARHLPVPQLVDGRPVVPPLTEWVLTRFEDDDRVFREFYAGVHSMQVYHGDIAGAMEAEAAVARAFKDHPNSRIRQWADWEERRALAEAARERTEAAERDL